MNRTASPGQSINLITLVVFNFFLALMKHVIIICDGSSLGNGSKGSRAAAVALVGYKNRWKAFAEYIGEATNQQAEIIAAAIGLEQLREPCRVTLFSDSRYVIETMASGWKRRANHDLWDRLDRAASNHQVEWKWIKGHAGHKLQEMVDSAARKIASSGNAEESFLIELAEKVSKSEAVI